MRYLAHPGRSQQQLADVISTTQANVSAWVRGIQRPGEEYRAALLHVAGIPVESWRTKEEQARVDRARAYAQKATGTEG